MSTKTNLWLFASLLLFGVGLLTLYKQEFAYGFLAVYSSLACLRVYQKSRLADRLREIQHNTQMQLMCELTAHLAISAKVNKSAFTDKPYGCVSMSVTEPHYLYARMLQCCGFKDLEEAATLVYDTVDKGIIEALRKGDDTKK